MPQKVDFLGIGVQKAGTSWLWQNLRQHPCIWMPPRKELHYFDRSPEYPTPSYLASSKLINRLFGMEQHNKQFRVELSRGFKKTIKSKTWQEFYWNFCYFSGNYSDSWYFSLFEFGEGKVKGEITPDYSIISLEDVKHIKKIIPDLKIILILRNPIDRAWSHLRYSWTRGMFEETRDLNKIKKFINKPGQTLRSDYLRTLNIWGSCFTKEKIYIGFYDDVMQNPQKLISNIFNFLEVESQYFVNPKELSRKINVSKELAIPTKLKHYLASKYYSDLLKLSHLVGGHSEVWLKEAEKILSS